MKKIDLEKYRSAWKKEQGFSSYKLSDSDIKKFLQASSGNINKLFKTGLSIDIAFKSLLAISFGGLIAVFVDHGIIISLNAALMVLSIGGIIFQIITFRKIPENGHPLQNLRNSLKIKIDFYNTRYIKSLLVGALSNSMFFLSGSMYFFYFKYGEIRPFQLDDYIVFGSAIILSFALGAFFQIKQHNFQIRQLENCLKDIDENTMYEHNLRNIKNRKMKNMIIAAITVILGLLLLSYFLFN